MKPDIAIGQRWRERSSGRIAVLLKVEVYGTCPAWTYEDERNGWHYSVAADWYVWDVWEFVANQEVIA